MTSAADAAAATPADPCANGADDGVCRWLLEGDLRPEVDPVLLETIFADPALADARHRGGSALEHLGRRLREWLLSFMDSSGAAGFAEWTRTLVLVAAVLLLAWLVFRWVNRRTRRDAPPWESPSLESAQTEVLELPSRHLARGREALPGTPREAIRQGLLALLSGLEEAGVIPPGRVRTNRELALALPTSGASSDDLTGLAELLAWYDRVFYSLAAVAPAEAAAFLDRIESRLSALGSREVAA